MAKKKLIGINDRRADWALSAADHFKDLTGDNDLETVLGDLMADIMLLCKREGIPFTAILEKGRRFHKDEASGECKKCKGIFDPWDEKEEDGICSECDGTMKGKK